MHSSNQPNPTSLNLDTLPPPTLPAPSVAELTEFISELLDRNGPDVSDYAAVLSWFSTVSELRAISALSSSDHEILISSFGDAMSKETLQGFVATRPHGYAGDFDIIDRIYQHHLSSDERFVRWDKFFQAQPAVKAVRNRKTFFHQCLNRLRERMPEARVLVIGSGPGRDLLEHFVQHPNSRVRFDCIEQDGAAIAYASSHERLLSHRVRFRQQNALRFHTSDLYDFIWAGGIFDYFSDRVFEALLRRLRSFLADSGQLVVGNFSERNPTRAYMEFGGWKLNHRSSDKLRDLAFSSRKEGDLVDVEAEPEGVNLFLRIREGGQNA